MYQNWCPVMVPVAGVEPARVISPTDFELFASYGIQTNSNPYSWINAPYAPYELSNNNAEINRLKKRIESLERREETGFVGWQFEGGEAVANTEENRLQLLFDEKPSEEQRSKLKGWGFRWSPSNKAWQRQLNSNAIYAAGQIDFIKPLDGRTPRELQPKPKAKDEQER